MYRRLAQAALVAAPFLIGCGGGTNPVQPTDLTAGAAAGVKCDPKDVAEEAMTFVVDWKDGQRSALESAMGKGIAVVKYSCDGAKVLPACRVTGDYGYAGSTRRKKVINMNDAMQAQAQFGGRYIGASFKGAFAQGRSLNMAYTTVGANSTTVTNVDKGMLTGRCKGATHFVYEAEVGAFAVGTSSKGEASAFGEIFGQGSASGSTSSDKKAMTNDGMLKACNDASRKDLEATEDCGAIVRISMLPIEESASVKSTGVVDLRSCPDGFVFADSECVPKTSTPVFLCDKNNYTQCFDFCEKGDLGSCGRLGAIGLPHIVLAPTKADSTFQKSHWRANGHKVRDGLSKACHSNEANACVAAWWAIMHSDKVKYGTKMPQAMYPPRTIILDNLIQTGCAGGEGHACQQMARSASQGLTDNDLLAIKQGCSRSAIACKVLGDTNAKISEIGMDISNKNRTVDAAAAHAAYQRACDGGVPDGCYALGLMYSTKAELFGFLDEPSIAMGGIDALTHLTTLAGSDAKRAQHYFKRSCDLGTGAWMSKMHEDACTFKK